jgi:hypothetical protein
MDFNSDDLGPHETYACMTGKQFREMIRLK